MRCKTILNYILQVILIELHIMIKYKTMAVSNWLDSLQPAFIELIF